MWQRIAIVGLQVVATAARTAGVFSFTTAAAPDLQNEYDQALDSVCSTPGWVGADCDSTFAWAPASSKNEPVVTAWLYGDTFVGTFSTASNERNLPAAMPHSTMGFTRAESSSGLSFIINRTTEAAPPASLFAPLDANPHNDYYWVMQGVMASEQLSLNRTFLAMAGRIRNDPIPGPLAFMQVATSVVAVSNPDAAWKEWHFTTCDLPGDANVSWTTGFATPRPAYFPSHNETVHVFGSRANADRSGDIVLMRTTPAALRNCDIASGDGSTQFYVDSGTGTPTWTEQLPTDISQYHSLMPISLSESAIYWHTGLSLWLMPAIQFLSSTIQLWYSPALEGPWALHPQPLLAISAPCSTAKFFSYAPKWHPTVPTADGGLLFSYVCNAWNETDLFAAGVGNAVYVPQFYSFSV